MCFLVLIWLQSCVFCRCGPCQLMVPILNEVSETLKDIIAVVKIDTEKYPSLANKYQIEALPTFILFKDGKLWDRFVSFLSRMNTAYLLLASKAQL